MLTVGLQRSMEFPLLALQDVYHVLLANLLTLQEPHHVKTASPTLFLNILRAPPVCSAHEEHIRLAHGRKQVAEFCSILVFPHVLCLLSSPHPLHPPTLPPLPPPSPLTCRTSFTSPIYLVSLPLISTSPSSRDLTIYSRCLLK